MLSNITYAMSSMQYEVVVCAERHENVNYGQEKHQLVETSRNGRIDWISRQEIWNGTYKYAYSIYIKDLKKNMNKVKEMKHMKQQPSTEKTPEKTIRELEAIAIKTAENKTQKGEKMKSLSDLRDSIKSSNICVILVLAEKMKIIISGIHYVNEYQVR